MVVYSGVTSSGVRYKIDDSLAAPRGSEEEKRIIQEQRRTAYNILLNWARRQIETTGKVEAE